MNLTKQKTFKYLVGKEKNNPNFYVHCFIVCWHGYLLCDNVSYLFEQKFQLTGIFFVLMEKLYL